MGGKPRQPSLGATHENYSANWGTPAGQHGSPNWWRWIVSTLNRTTGAELFDPCPDGWSPDQPSGLDVVWPCDRPWYVNHPGARGSTALWWGKAIAELESVKRSMSKAALAADPSQLIWCLFSVEQIRFMDPSPLELPGHMVWPLSRTPFISLDDYNPADHGRRGKVRRRGHPNMQPGNWSSWWCSEHVDICRATIPVPSIVTRTGTSNIVRASAHLLDGLDVCSSSESPVAVAHMRSALRQLGYSYNPEVF